jgi:hypothetical protein
VSKHAEVALALPGLLGLAPQGRTQQPLVPGEGALRLPALPVDPAVPTATRLLAEALDHLPPIARLRPLAAPVPAVERDDRGADAELLPGQAVVRLAVKGGVAQHAVPADNQRRLLQDRAELRGIVTGSDRDGGPGEEVAARVTSDGELDPGLGTVRGARADIEVAGGVAALQAGGIDGCLGLVPAQAAFLGARSGLEEEQDELPFFSSRCAALQRVE